MTVGATNFEFIEVLEQQKLKQLSMVYSTQLITRHLLFLAMRRWQRMFESPIALAGMTKQH